MTAWMSSGGAKSYPDVHFPRCRCTQEISANCAGDPRLGRLTIGAVRKAKPETTVGEESLPCPLLELRFG
jgi:hypothetical protein